MHGLIDWAGAALQQCRSFTRCISIRCSSGWLFSFFFLSPFFHERTRRSLCKNTEWVACWLSRCRQGLATFPLHRGMGKKMELRGGINCDAHWWELVRVSAGVGLRILTFISSQASCFGGSPMLLYKLALPASAPQLHQHTLHRYSPAVFHDHDYLPRPQSSPQRRSHDHGPWH